MKKNRAGADAAVGVSGSVTSIHFEHDKYPLLKNMYGERYVEYRRRWAAGKSEPYPDFPLHIDIISNESCNLRCAICPLSERQRSGRAAITDEVLGRLREESIRYGLCAVNISGAEPLSGKESFLKVLETCQAIAPMDFMIHTNGTLLTESILAAIMDAGVTTLCVSLDAATPETYRAVRGKDCLLRIEKSLIRLAELKKERRVQFPFVQLSFCVNPLNYREKEIFNERWRHIGQLFCFQQYYWEEGVNVSPAGDFEIDLERDCDEPFLRCAVAPNGDVFPCCASRNEELIIGNILESSIYDLWHGDQMNAIRRSLKDAPGFVRCNTCESCLKSTYVLKA